MLLNVANIFYSLSPSDRNDIAPTCSALTIVICPISIDLPTVWPRFNDPLRLETALVDYQALI
jgi:hypothetical protein